MVLCDLSPIECKHGATKRTDSDEGCTTSINKYGLPNPPVCPNCKCTGCAEVNTDGRWGGDRCATCAWKQPECTAGRKGILYKEHCKCKYCDLNKGWTGHRCETCARESTDCHHAGTMNKATCQCENCAGDVGEWGGQLCHRYVCLPSTMVCPQLFCSPSSTFVRLLLLN